MISKAVDPSTADYAVITGVQIHNWASNLEDPTSVSLEFVHIGKSYVVMDGRRVYLDLAKVPVSGQGQAQGWGQEGGWGWTVENDSW